MQPKAEPLLTFAPVSESNFDELAEMRIAAMKPSLERVGRFDPQRARDRLKSSFFPTHSQVIVVDGVRVGFYTFRPSENGFYLDHFYIQPAFQSRGIGSRVLRMLLRIADERGDWIRLGALRESDSNQFYQRHGVAVERNDQWDIYYARNPTDRKDGEPGATDNPDDAQRLREDH